MNLLSMRKCLWAISGAFVAFLTFAAHGSANVFDDAVFWFRGGKDCVTANGIMQQGEFFDDLHADNVNHGNHKSSMVNYLADSNSKAFKENAAFVSEQVVFPALGKSVEKNMQVLRLSNKSVRNPSDNKLYFWPEAVNPRSIFANNNIASEYTIVSRIRLDEDGLNRDECFLKIGYNSSAKQGMWLGFTNPSTSWYAGCRRVGGYCTPSSDDSSSAFQLNLPVPTNTWVDIAVVVGNGKLRVGVVVPESLSSHNNNPSIAFDETPMWTDNCTLLGDNYYRLFCYTGQTTYQLSDNADKTCFIGSVQQMAIWGRALSDQEVMAAFGMPRPAIFRTGLDNGDSTEFGGTRSGAEQTIDGLGSWQDIANTMLAGDEWTVNFNALRDEAGLEQIFSIKSLHGSTTAKIEPTLNGTSLGERRVASNARVFWPVATNLVVEGANTLTVRRVDADSGSFLMDAMEFGGSLGVGTDAATTNDGRTPPSRTATGVPSAADPNLQHWPQELQPYSGVTNLRFRVWVDPDVVNVASSKFRTLTLLTNKSDKTLQGDEKFTLFVNGTEKGEHGTDTSLEEIVLDFAPGELIGGWNLIELKSAPYETCRWYVGYYRFETVLSRPFSLPPPGMTIVIK